MVLSNDMLWKILEIGGKFSGEKCGPNDAGRIPELVTDWKLKN